MEFIIYIIIFFIVAVLLSVKTDNKLLSFILIFYIFTQPIMSQKFVIDLSGMPFNLQPNRILLFLMLSFLVSDLVLKRNSKDNHKMELERVDIKSKGDTFQYSRKQRPAFELFLYSYLILIIISLLFNFNRIQVKNVIVVPAEILLFIFVYYVLKRHATPSLIEAWLKAIVILSLFAAIVAIYQVLVDSSFLKICPPRHAFGYVIRSSAFFRSEYELGYFINFAIIVFLVRYWGKPSLFIALPFLIIALFTTFHRLNWIIFLVCSTSYLFIFKRIKTTILPLFVLIALSGIILISYFANPWGYTQLANRTDVKAFVEERFLSDTVTGRLHQFVITAKVLPKYFMGIGGYDNKEYCNLMAKHGMPLYVVHNGYLATGIKYGFLAMIAFTGLIVSMLLFFKKLISLDRPATAYPFFIVLIWMISNLSNSISLFRTYFVLIVAIVCGLFVSLYGEGEETAHSERRTS